MRTIRAEMDNPSPSTELPGDGVSDCWKASKILEWCSLESHAGIADFEPYLGFFFTALQTSMPATLPLRR